MTKEMALRATQALTNIEDFELFIEEIEKVLEDFALGNFETKLKVFLEEELHRRNEILKNLQEMFFMTNSVYYYAEEAVVFPTKSDARNFFFETDLVEQYDTDYEFREYLRENHSIDEVFKMTDDEKQNIVDDYEEALFEDWLDEEVVKCELYER